MVYTNTIQAIMMAIVAIILLGSGYEFLQGGVGGIVDALAEIDPRLTQSTFEESPMFRDYWEIIFFQIIVGVAIVCQPHIITKSLLLQKDEDVNKYLFVGIAVQTIFFLVVAAGFFARLTFPDLTIGGEALAMDDIILQYVVSEFPVVISLVLILGMISAGLSTLEGLIQSLSTSITSDILQPLAIKLKKPIASHRMVSLNKVVIVLLAVVTIFISWDQIVNPKLSVSILALNGVYAYFSAAFVPVLMGIFLKKVNV